MSDPGRHLSLAWTLLSFLPVYLIVGAIIYSYGRRALSRLRP